MKYYGVWEEGMSLGEMAQTWSHLQYLRNEERKENPLAALAKKMGNRKG